MAISLDILKLQIWLSHTITSLGCFCIIVGPISHSEISANPIEKPIELQFDGLFDRISRNLRMSTFFGVICLALGKPFYTKTSEVIRK